MSLDSFFWSGVWRSGRIVACDKELGQFLDTGNTATLARYIDLLQGAGLLAGIPRYAGPLSNRVANRKLNVLNTSLMTAPYGDSFEDAGPTGASGAGPSRARSGRIS